jgi:hypothetical protein
MVAASVAIFALKEKSASCDRSNLSVEILTDSQKKSSGCGCAFLVAVVVKTL